MIMELNDLYALVRSSEGITTDSRSAGKGQVFFALRGPNHDGNIHAPSAVSAGALAAVVDDPSLKGDKYIVVDDVLATLSSLAAYHRKNINIPVIAITGSNGKTTTKELITAVLSVKGRVHSTSGNYNNHIGVPLTILSAPDGTQFLVVEMGANHKGEIAGLCTVAMPTHGIITNIGTAHIEGFGSFEEVRAAKSELYRWLQKSSGTAIFNDRNTILSELVKDILHTGIPYSSPAGSALEAEVSDGESMYLSVRASYEGKSYVFSTNLFGAYNIDNVKAAMAAGLLFGVPFSSILSAISSYWPANNRSQVVDTGRNIVIRDAYNANPSSMEKAVASFAGLKALKKMVILGDMLELGSESRNGHDKIFKQVEVLPDVEICLVGPLFAEAAADSRARLFRSAYEMSEWLASSPISGFTILVKGSRGMMLEKIYPLL
jgi:UDP-N-acetylmuramoyl-tripeptide--D-alanyl-D-alanine ligase